MITRPKMEDYAFPKSENDYEQLGFYADYLEEYCDILECALKQLIYDASYHDINFVQIAESDNESELFFNCMRNKERKSLFSTDWIDGIYNYYLIKGDKLIHNFED